MTGEEMRKKRIVVTKDTLRRIRKTLQKEIKLKEIAEEVEISISCARALCEKISKGMSDEEILNAKKGRPSNLNEDLKSEIRNILDVDPSNTLKSLANNLNNKNINAAPSKISKYLKKMEFTRKRLSLVPQERNSPRVIDERQRYCRLINNVPNSDLVFLDETGFNLHTKKNYGYSLKNTKCCFTVPANRGKNVSLMAAINIAGVVAFEIKEGSYNGNSFVDFINNNLKTYFERNPKHILVMDNCAFHHRRDVIELLTALGILYQFLPPYSPQLNPIEEYFSSVKSNYTSIRPPANNISELEQNLTSVMSTTTTSFYGFFAHMRTWIDRGIARIEFY